MMYSTVWRKAIGPVPFWSCGLFALVLAGCGGAMPEPQAPPPPQVEVAVPYTKQVVEWDPYTGRLEAVDFVEVRARVSGYIESVDFEEGHLVKKDDILFVIDRRPFLAAKRQAEASRQESLARLEEARAAKIQAEAEKKRTEAQLLLTRQKLERVRRLVQQNVATQDELDQAVSEFDQASANIDFAAANIKSREADILIAEGNIEVAQANLETAELDLEYTQVRAPITGLVSRIQVTRGNLITGGAQGATLLTTIVSQDPIHCYFDANEQELLKYTRLAQAGQRVSSRDAKNPAYLELVDETRFPHLGHMDFVDNRVDPNTGTMRARAIFRNPDHVLQPGLFARVCIPGSAPYEAILIPDAAILSDQSERYVFVVEENVAIRRPVKVGPMIDGLRVVREGLSPHEQLIIAGLQRVQNGAPVTPEQGNIAAREIDDGLPNTFEPVSKENWIERNGSAHLRPDSAPTKTAVLVGSEKEGVTP